MRNLRSMLSRVAALPMFLSACESPPREAGLAFDTPRQEQRSFAPACPVPSDKAANAQIEGELVRTIAAGVPPDTLATEWERLNDAAKACRSKN